MEVKVNVCTKKKKYYVRHVEGNELLAGGLGSPSAFLVVSGC